MERQRDATQRFGRRGVRPALRSEDAAMIVNLHVTQRCNLRCDYCYATRAEASYQDDRFSYPSWGPPDGGPGPESMETNLRTAVKDYVMWLKAQGAL